MLSAEFERALGEHRAPLLRHCYRMLGSFAEAEDLVQDTLARAWTQRGEYRGEAPVQRWLFTIATHACLNALAQRKVRELPQWGGTAPSSHFVAGELEPDRYLTPAADAQLFPSPAETTETRESVALAFLALLQRLPPAQRAALLLKDVLGWSAQEIAGALEQTLPAVHSALHRARQLQAEADVVSLGEQPPPQAVSDFVRAWESRDLQRLVELLREDVVLAMPPHSIWFAGREDVRRFFMSPEFAGFWGSGIRVEPTRSNGAPAFCFFRDASSGAGRLHSVMVTRFREGAVAEMTVFIGAAYFRGFLPDAENARTVSSGSAVLDKKGDAP